MAVRLISSVLLALTCLACTVPAQADMIGDFFVHIGRETKRRCCWPQPFVCPDRYAVRAPFAIMEENGWRRQNMLADHHFVAETGQLTEAGRLKVQSILSEIPHQHRVVYVHTDKTPMLTAARIASVQQLAVQLSPQDLPPVIPTSVSPAGSPASQINAIGRKFQSSTPSPRLPDATGGGGSGGGEEQK